MGMASEIAIERTVQVVAKKIKKELKENSNKTSVCKALKKLEGLYLNSSNIPHLIG